MALTEQLDSIHVLQAQNGWLAVDKPCGISVHNDPGKDLVSILNARLAADPRLSRSLEITTRTGIFPVHRLDKETSGVILLACHEKTARLLSEQFFKNQVQKTYLALVHGRIDTPLPEKGFYTWHTPLAKQAGGRHNPKGNKPFKACETRYRVIRTSHHYSLIKIDLVTGRKHQIRRHAKLAGHPVTGDSRYGSKKSVDFLKTRCAYGHLGLHCLSIEITDPVDTGQESRICIQSENPRNDMMKLIENDKKKIIIN